ncbi:hypothetical protein BKA63DRAFT_587525 [Paraphoma chrysanthemicola]|nr:hypothetical protein BKA63DRAFT_587525 [Paraphoma chrysanthemicola]
MCERKCCKIVAIALTAVLALATILTFTITIKHAPQPPDLPTHHQVLEDGNLLTELAMLSSNLHNIKDTRKMMQDRFHRALRTYGWDNWALEELEKVKIMNDDATRLVNHAIGESEAWSGSWVHFANSAANMSSSLMPNLEKTEPRSRLLIVLQSTLSNLYIPGQSVEELEAHKGICDVSTFSVDFIATLLRPIARLHRAFNDLYVTFDLVEQVTGAMSNGTGTEGWRFSRKLDDYS